MNHTPGPWRYSETWRPPIGRGPHKTNAEGNIFWGYSISGSDEHGGAILPTLAAVHNFPNAIEANAHLIASAPDLYETLDSAPEYQEGEDPEAFLGRYWGWLQRVSVVLDAARGETS